MNRYVIKFCVLSSVVLMIECRPQKAIQKNQNNAAEISERQNVSIDQTKSVDQIVKKTSRRRPTYSDVLERNLKKICTEFAQIFEHHALLKKSVPAEYSYHLNKLTGCIVEAVEDGRIRGYSANQLKQLGKSFFKSDYQRMAEASQGPLMRFKKEYLLQAIECLEYYKSAAKGTAFDNEVDAVLLNLKDLKKSLASVS